MANRRISMEKIRELLRLHEKCGLSNCQIARALNISRSVVGKYLVNLELSGITYQTITTMGDDEVMRTLETRKKESCEGYRILSDYYGMFSADLLIY